MINIEQTKKYCCEDLSLIENYEKAINDNTQIWVIHHKLEVQEDGTLISRDELKEKDLYWSRPAAELILLTKGEHTRLHNCNMREETKKKMKENHKGMLGKHHSEETKQKIKESHKGEKCYMYGKHHSEEAKKKMSAATKGDKNGMYGKHHSEEAKKKIREANIGKKYSDETRRKKRESMKKYWENKKKIEKNRDQEIHTYEKNYYDINSVMLF